MQSTTAHTNQTAHPKGWASQPQQKKINMTNPTPDASAKYHIEELADVIFNTRNFSGSQMRAIKEWEAENGILTSDEIFAAIQLANKMWDNA
jgi:hypothetical protein